MPTEIGSMFLTLGVNLAQFATGLNSAMRMIDDARAGFLRAGAGLTAGLTVPLMGFGAQAASVASDFEKQMNILEVAARSAGTSLEDLRDAAIRVGADTELVGISASQAADAMTNFYKAGLSTTDIFGDLQSYLDGTASLSGALRAAIDLAAASELDLAQASDVVAVAMATFGLSAEEATHIADSFVRAADASVAEVGDLAEALRNVGPTAAAFGWTLDDVNTALAILSTRGITGAEAGTNLKSMMTNLLRPTKDVKEALADLGVALYDSEGRLKSLPEIVGDLSKAMEGLTEEQRNQYVQTLAGTYGMKAMNTLLAEGVDGWKAMEEAIATAATAQESAAARTRGFDAAMEQFQGTIEALLIKVGTPLIQNFLTPLVRNITDLLGEFDQMFPGWEKWALLIGGVAAAGGPLLLLIGGLATGLSALLSPLGLVIAGIAALAAAFVTNAGGIRDKVLPVIQGIVGWFRDLIPKAIAVVQPYLERLGWLFDAIADAGFGSIEMWEVVEDILQRFASDLGLSSEAASRFVNILRTAFATAQEVAGAVLARLSDMLQGLWSTVQETWPRIQGLAEQVWGAVATIVQRFLSDVVPLLIEGFQNMVGWVAENWPRVQAIVETVLNAVQSVVQGVLTTVVPFALSQFNKVVSWVEENWPLIQATVETVLNAILSVVETVLGAVTSFWQSHHETIETVAAAVWDAVKTIIGTAVDVVLGLLKALMQLITGDFSGAWETLQGVVETVAEAVQRVAEDAFGAMRAVLEAVAQAVSEKVSPVLSSLASLVRDTVGPAIDWFRSNIVDPLAGSLSAVAGAISSVIDRIGALAGRLANLQLPDWLTPGSPTPFEIGLRGIADALQLLADKVVPAFVNALKRMSQSLAEDVRERIEAFVGMLDKAAKALMAVGEAALVVQELEIKGGFGKKVRQFLAQVEKLLQELRKTAGKFKEEALKALAPFLEALQGLGDAIGGAVEGLFALAAFERIPHLRDKVKVFASQLLALLGALRKAARQFKTEGLGMVKDFATAAGLVGSNMQDAVEGLQALGEFERVKDLADKAKTFASQMSMLLGALRKAARAVGDGVDLAVELALGAGTVGEAIRCAVDGLQALAEYKRVPANAIKTFARNLQTLMGEIRRVAREFKTKGLDAAVAFAAAAREVVGVIGPAVQGLKALLEYQTAENLPALAAALANDVASVVRYFQMSADYLGEEGYSAAGAFGQAVGTVMGAVKTACEALAALASYSGGLAVDTLKTFVSDVGRVVDQLGQAANLVGTEAAEAAARFATEVQTVFGFVAGAVEVLRKLKDYSGPATDDIDQFVEDVNYVLDRIAEAVAAMFSVDERGRFAVLDLYMRGYNATVRWLQGMIDGVSHMAPQLIEAVRQLMNRTTAVAEDELGIHSPSEAFSEIGALTVQGLVEGILNRAREALQAMIDLIDRISGKNVRDYYEAGRDSALEWLRGWAETMRAASLTAAIPAAVLAGAGAGAGGGGGAMGPIYISFHVENLQAEDQASLEQMAQTVSEALVSALRRRGVA